MKRTHARIAAQIRRRIGAHVPMIGRGVPSDVYERARSESDRAESLARYLAAHLADVDRRAFAAACGVPSIAR